MEAIDQRIKWVRLPNMQQKNEMDHVGATLCGCPNKAQKDRLQANGNRRIKASNSEEFIDKLG